jgi:uncharacterized protein (DUF1499 family)
MANIRDLIVRLALIVALLLPVYFLVAALGTKFGLFDWTVGFVRMTVMWGAPILLGAAGLAILAFGLSLLVPPRRGAITALVALLVPLAGLGYAFYVRAQAQTIPPIHDISTDLVDPPGFSQAVIDARAAIPEGNGLDLLDKRTDDGRPFTELQREAYGDIEPVVTGRSTDEAFDAALAQAQAQGWAIGVSDRDAGVIEASASTFWYGFTDDIVMRVRPEGTGARIDMRSVSRVGRSDLGANAARMRPYLTSLRARLEGAD